jgi:hypothetical protein
MPKAVILAILPLKLLLGHKVNPLPLINFHNCYLL